MERLCSDAGQSFSGPGDWEKILSDKRQIPTWQYLPIGYRNDGAEPHWRAILDDDGRIMVMIAHNNDIADGWQRADDAGYPQYEANLSIRMGVNFAIYALTH